MSDQRTFTRAELPRSLDRALAAAVSRGGRAPVILRLTEVAGYTDWALLVSARSDRQVRGIIDGILEAVAAGPTPEAESAAADSDDPPKLIGTDGLDLYLWALLDYGDFLIHVFYHPVRRHYDLESMWSDAPRVELGLAAEIMDAAELDGLTAPDPMPDYRGDITFGGFEDEFVDDEDDEDPEFVDDDLFDDDGPELEPGTPARAEPSPDDDLFD